MLKDKKAVLFDLDGTLVDSMWVWTQIDIDYLGSYGYSVPEDLQRSIEGMGFTEVAVYFKERFHIPDSIEKIKKTWNEMAIEQYSHAVPLKPGLISFLPWLRKQGMKTAVASSNDVGLVEACLKGHGIRQYFDAVLTVREIGRGKPAPDVYLEAAARLGVQPSECLVFEDIEPGIMAGKNAGMKVCAVEDSYSVFQKKEKRACADYYIESYEQVMDGTYEDL
jgi:16S rRNA pseudouridine516 synthase